MARKASSSFVRVAAMAGPAVVMGGVLAGGVVMGGVLPARGAQTLCPADGFDLCFPDLDDGAPNAACDRSEDDAAEITACLDSVCSSEGDEPEPGFFAYCCAEGGSARFDDFCVFVVQASCSGIADHCEDRCPPLELLLGTVTLAPPPEACLDDYPSFIAGVCTADPFCCTTSWDALCANEAIELGGD